METTYQFPNKAESKAIATLKHAPLGLTELDKDGNIVTDNILGETWMKEIREAHGIPNTPNLFPVLRLIAPGLVEAIVSFQPPAGSIAKVAHKFSYTLRGKKITRVFDFHANKLPDSNIMLSYDDVTEKFQREEAMRQAMLDKAVEQSKYEIASGILHDIGNAIVGFGAYVTRIRRIEEQNSSTNLQQLATFIDSRQMEFGQVIGADKAKAITDMMHGIASDQQKRQAEIGKAITEQLSIITHIQEILNIQRQYVSGYETQERKPVQVRSIINDCMAMLFASYDKKGIAVELVLSPDAPAIKGDRTQLMQVIMNILKNSLEAIHTHTIDKRVSIQLKNMGGELQLIVLDNGCGFDEKVGACLFDRGFTTKSSGSGLGLYNCKAILESHEGSISITSEGKDKGAITTIIFKV
jgi:signal transduction histidine kinase